MRQRKAFTLVEMMIVVGLIVVLIALAVTGYSKLVNASAERGTTTALQNAQSLLAEYEQAVGLGRLGFGDPTFPYHGGYFSQSDAPSQAEQGNAIGIGTPCAAGLVADSGSFSSDPSALVPYRFPGKPDANGNIPYTLDYTKERAVFNTAAVMMYIARLPQARPILSSLPAKSFLQYAGQPIKLSGNEAPVMLDGWGNPIIYVPPGGLVWEKITSMDGSSNPPIVHASRYLVRTSGVTTLPEVTYTQGQPPAASAFVPLKAGDRPFWASAGPDGNFDNGDDNVYSFR